MQFVHAEAPAESNRHASRHTTAAVSLIRVAVAAAATAYARYAEGLPSLPLV
jgi:hypothetical protein